MRKAIAAMALGLSLLASLPSQAAALVPRVGDFWRYRLSDGSSASLEVVRVRTEAQRTIATLDRTWQHGDTPRRQRLTLLCSPDGLALRLPGTTGLDFGPIVCFMTEAGLHDSWTAQQGSYPTTDGETVAYRVIAQLEAFETITIPAGTFRCQRIAYRIALPAAEPSDVRTGMWVWVKPEVGILKTRSLRAGQLTETELTAFGRAGGGEP